MIVLPAIDLKDHRVVRLRKGEFDTVHQVADDPLETALAFAAAGAEWVHMVDLDGARGGVGKRRILDSFRRSGFPPPDGSEAGSGSDSGDGSAAPGP